MTPHPVPESDNKACVSEVDQPNTGFDKRPDEEAGMDVTKVVDGHEDEDMKVYGQVEHIVFTEEEERHVKRKIDLILLPMLCGCYIFSFLDKTLLNYSSIFGLRTALGLHGSDYSWLGSIFYFGYMFGSIMWTQLIRRRPQNIGKMVAGAMCIWSSITLLTPLASNFSSMAAIRFFLGVIESITGAVFVVITSNWWTRQEQAFRAAFWLGGTPIGNFIGGLLSYAIGKVHGEVATWKVFFLLFGSLSFAYSIFLFVMLPDNQLNARWLDERQKKIAIARVRQNQTVTADDRWKWNQFWEAFRDPQTWFFFVTAIGNTMPSTFASQFSSQIVKGFGFTRLQTTLISTCPAATIQLSTFLIFSWIASHFKNIRLFLALIASVPPLIGAILLHVLPQDNTAGRLAGYYLTYTHTMSFTLATGLMASNYAGNTKKTTASGLVFVGWAAGLIAGPQFFLDSQAPVFELAFRMLMGCYAMMIVLPLCQYTWYRYENARRDRLVADRAASGPSWSPDFTDKTDFEQEETFRYVM